jgi:hypothetical protein
MHPEKLVQYWQASLNDAELESLDLKNVPHTPVTIQSLENGRLPNKALSMLDPDSEQPNTIDSDKQESQEDYLHVVIAPLVLYPSTNRGRPNRYKKPLLPLLIPAGLDKDGTIIYGEDFSRPWIARNFLEPAVGDLVLGDVNEMDKYLGYHPLFPGEDLQDNWRQVLSYSKEMLDDISDSQWQEVVAEAGFIVDEHALVISVEKISGMTRHIQHVYGHLLKNKKLPGLLMTIAKDPAGSVRAALNVDQWAEVASKHLGSFHSEYPLAPSQRKALHHALSTKPGEICAISGPPGTGKTTLLHSIVASLWVQAALDRTPPPLIVVSSTNNQAVTNVLDSLHSFDSIERWMPVENFGLYLVNSREKQAESAKKGILSVNYFGTGFPETIENSSTLLKFKDRYLEECSQYFGRPVRHVGAALDLLHKKLSSAASNLRNGLSIAYSYKKLLTSAGSVDHINRQTADLKRDQSEKRKALEASKQLRLAWLDHCQQEPSIYSLLSFLPPIKRKRQLWNEEFLMNRLPDEDLKPDAEQIESFIDERYRSSRHRVQEIGNRIENLEATRRKIDSLEQKWDAWRQDNRAIGLDLAKTTNLEKADGEAESRCIHNWLDTHTRYELLLLATHYWEGRWLKEVTEIEANRGDYVRRGVSKSQEDRFRRYAMLTPCFITTMHSGPSFFYYYRGQQMPLFESIDWLIIDEAGQVSPEVAGAMFSLAKRAIVVGDEQQIQPVWSVPEQADRTNLERLGLAKNDEAYLALLDKGTTASSGSVMRFSRNVSLVGEPGQIKKTTLDRGLLLTEHRRCVPQVIAYCNELAYGGLLQPYRKALKDYPWPHMGYVHIQGDCQRRGGSRYNHREAESVVAWLKENREQLIEHYKEDIEDIVGIVTPFAAQKRLIRQLLKESDFASIQTGTVHAFQGAERRLMLFSPVYTASEQGIYFFDRNVNMLNVAVSRAKDSFIVIGDMDIFNQAVRTPSGLLARHLFADESNEIALLALPVRQDAGDSDDVHIIDTLDLHIKTLRRAFETAEKRLIIVSPFLRWRAVEADGIPGLASEAIERGVEVSVYTDLSFNESLDLRAARKAQEWLAEAGANILVCNNIHSKLICIDDKIFIEGSFNWLSAERTIEKYVRHDTSIIYMGEQASSFISSTLSDMESRVITKP